ncbi:plasmid stabilization protein, partial [Vibrio parahaemolyticus]
LKAKDPRAAARAGLKIISSMREVAKAPSIGKPIENMPQEFRDWIIEFGKSGYVARIE